MGRPDLSAIRKTEILDAFERCVARFGLEGSSLEKVAEEAGMKRSILRHYIGNRSQLIEELAGRVVAKYTSFFDQFVDSIGNDDPVTKLLDFFFPNEPFGSTESILVIEALIGAGEKFPGVRKRMLAYLEELVDKTANLLKNIASQATSRQRWDVAYGVVSICFNQDSLSPLSLPARYRKAARMCAKQLIQSLLPTH